MSSFPSMYRFSRPTCYVILLPKAISPCRDVYLELLHLAVDDLVGVVRVNERRLYVGVAEHFRYHLDGHPEGDARGGEGVARDVRVQVAVEVQLLGGGAEILVERGVVHHVQGRFANALEKG